MSGQAVAEYIYLNKQKSYRMGCPDVITAVCERRVNLLSERYTFSVHADGAVKYSAFLIRRVDQRDRLPVG